MRTVLTPINFKPGVNKDDPYYTSRGSYVDTDKVRFWRGYPENIGGTEKITPISSRAGAGGNGPGPT